MNWIFLNEDEKQSWDTTAAALNKAQQLEQERSQFQPATTQPSQVRKSPIERHKPVPLSVVNNNKPITKNFGDI